MTELSTKLGLYNTNWLDHTYAETEDLDRHFSTIRVTTQKLTELLKSPEKTTPLLEKLTASLESVYAELSHTLPFRRLVFTGASGPFLQELLLLHTAAQEKYPLAAKRLRNPLFITSDQNKRIKYQLGASTLIPPLAIMIDDYAESLDKALAYLPEIFPGRSMLVLGMKPPEKLLPPARTLFKRFSWEQRFKVGVVDEALTDFLKQVAGLASEINTIQTNSEFWKSVQPFDYRWDSNKLTPEQTAVLTAAASVLDQFRTQLRDYLAAPTKIAETRVDTV